MSAATAIAADDLPLQRFYRWEREKANQVFLTQPYGGGVVRDMTWAQAADETRRLAAWLKAQGWPAGSTVAILGKNSAHWIMADVAIWMAGHVSVPIYPTFNGDALGYILNHSGARACFVGKLDDTNALPAGIPEQMPLVTLPLSPDLPASLRTDAITPWDSIVASTQPLADSPVRAAAELATLIYTSGTTGNPKGVMQTFGALAWGLASANQRVPIHGDDRLFSYLPLAHVAERMVIEQAALKHGARVFFAESLDTFVADLQRARPTVFFSVPRLWVKFQQGVHAKMPPAKLQRLLKIPILGGIVRRKVLTGLGLDQCRLAAGGAAPMPADVLRWYRDLGLDLIEVYGMTENCGVSHATAPGTFMPGTVGAPYPGVEQRIDPVSGEIQVRGGSLMQGYYKDEVQTRDAFTDDGWLRTGDKGQVDAAGVLRITGRVKDLFKTSKGKYVAPAPIEDLLVTHPAIEACAVTGANLAQPLGIVMMSADAASGAASDEGRRALIDSLTAHLRSVNERLEAHEKLDCLAVITTPWTPENGMVTPTLKVKRARIEDAYAAQYERWVDTRQPVVWTGH